ncbi:unnamed protein product [Malus baccata var. baccata]
MKVILDKELLLAALCFWCSATNTMVLPLSPIGPTILDLTAILGTSPTGIPVDSALPGYPLNLNLNALFDKRALETLSSEGQTPSNEETSYNSMGADEDANLRQSWGSFIVTRDLPLGCSRSLKKVMVVAAAAAERKSVVSKKAKIVAHALLIKRPRREVKLTTKPSRPAKRIKKLAKKGDREIHKRPISTEETIQARPVSEVGKPVGVPSVEATPVLEKAVPANERTSPANPKPSVFVLEESEGSDEVPLANRPHSCRQPPPMSEVAAQFDPPMVDRGKRPAEEPAVATETPAPPQDQDLNSASKADAPVGPSTVDRGKRPPGEPEATVETPVHPQDQDLDIPLQKATSTFVPIHYFHRKCYAPKGVIYVSWPPQWLSNVDNLHRSRELRSNLRYWARPLSSLGSSNDPEDMTEVSSRQALWEVEFKALLSSTTGGAGSSATITEVADSTTLAWLRKVLSLLASQVLERKGLDLLGACLNDLGADGQLIGEAIVQASPTLKRVRETFSIFENALKAEQDLQAATAIQDTLRPKIDVLKVKREALADLDPSKG